MQKKWLLLGVLVLGALPLAGEADNYGQEVLEAAVPYRSAPADVLGRTQADEASERGGGGGAEESEEASLARALFERASEKMESPQRGEQQEGVRLLLEAAHNGHAVAQVTAGLYYLHGHGTLLKSSQQAQTWFRRAGQGSLSGVGAGVCRRIGVMLREGTNGLEADPEVALIYLSEAARRGHYGAMTETARALADGGQFVKAARMYRRAWEKQPSAQIGRELADILFDEVGDAEAMKAAFWLYWQADNRQACAHCRYRLGVMKLHGMGTIENNAEAVEWFSAAAALNHPKAQFTLGVVYSTGLVVTRDYVTALKWLNIARHNGYAEASGLIREVKTQVKREDVERSQRMASQWLAMDR